MTDWVRKGNGVCGGVSGCVFACMCVHAHACVWGLQSKSFKRREKRGDKLAKMCVCVCVCVCVGEREREREK